MATSYPSTSAPPQQPPAPPQGQSPPVVVSDIPTLSTQYPAIPVNTINSISSRPRLITAHQHQQHQQQQPQQQQPQPHHSISPSGQHQQSRKPAIMDPPGEHISQSQALTGFPSPDINWAQANPKYNEDCTRMTYSIQQAVPEAVRRIVRDNWEKCLLGSDFHKTFVLNASIHHASGPIIQRAVRDFGHKMVPDAKVDFIRQMSSTDLDEVADLIIQNASNRLLDKALEKRLRTIEAKPLINALARAERLGYEPGDIVDEDDHTQGREHVIPTGNAADAVKPAAPSTPAAPLQAQSQVGSSQGSSRGARLQCPICFRAFTHQSSYSYHTRKQVCSRAPPNGKGFTSSCQHCGQGFSTTVGLQYHHANKVCGDYTAPPDNPAANGASSSQPTPTKPTHPAPVQTPSYKSYVPPAPTQLNVTTPTTPDPHDPYGHLEPDRRAALEAELRSAEDQYGEKMRLAEQLPDPAESKTKLEGLRNSFATRQSNIRKKYGVRLRERRTRQQIDAERLRMGLKPELGEGPPTKTKRARKSEGPVVGSPVVSSPAAVHTPSGGGWTAANVTPAAQNGYAHDAKRRKTETDVDSGDKRAHGSPIGQPSPTVQEAGHGLGGAVVRVAVHNPTVPSRTDVVAGRDDPAAQDRNSSMDVGSHDVPMAVDDSSSDPDDEEGIPATLPAAVRQTLTPQKGKL